MCGARVVVPPPGQATMLQLLHNSHSSVVKMKALACSEHIGQQLGQCEENARNSTRAPFRPSIFSNRSHGHGHGHGFI